MYSLEIYPAAHDLFIATDGSDNFRHTTTAFAIEFGGFSVWLEALLQSGQNIDEFLEDDFKIMRKHDFHLYNCDTDSCRQGDSQSRGTRGPTCCDWYFGGLKYRPKSGVSEVGEEPESEEPNYQEWEEDLLGGALRSQLGEYVPEIDSERYITFLFALLFLQAILVIDKLVNPFSPSPGTNISVSQVGKERPDPSTSNITTVEISTHGKSSKRQWVKKMLRMEASRRTSKTGLMY